MAKPSGTQQEPMTLKDLRFADCLLDYSDYIGKHNYVPLPVFREAWDKAMRGRVSRLEAKATPSP